MYRFIQKQSQPNAARHFPVKVLCQTLGVNRSGYYEWLKPAQTLPTARGNTRPVKTDNTQQIKDL